MASHGPPWLRSCFRTRGHVSKVFFPCIFTLTTDSLGISVTTTAFCLARQAVQHIIKRSRCGRLYSLVRNLSRPCCTTRFYCCCLASVGYDRQSMLVGNYFFQSHRAVIWNLIHTTRLAGCKVTPFRCQQHDNNEKLSAKRA